MIIFWDNLEMKNELPTSKSFNSTLPTIFPQTKGVFLATTVEWRSMHTWAYGKPLHTSPILTLNQAVTRVDWITRIIDRYGFSSLKLVLSLLCGTFAYSGRSVCLYAALCIVCGQIYKSNRNAGTIFRLLPLSTPWVHPNHSIWGGGQIGDHNLTLELRPNSDRD